MSKLIQLRQRSKAIDTIKKITHAMRLISMSTHAHLQHLQDSLTRYTRDVDQLFVHLMDYAPTWHNPIIHPEQDAASKSLVLLMGSQKGLCGSFNTNLFKRYAHELEERDLEEFDLVVVGQKAVDFAKSIGEEPKQSYAKFNTHRLVAIAREITHLLIYTKPSYTSVLIFSNLPQSFFIQRPHVTELVPIRPQEQTDMPEKNEFSWEESPASLLDRLLPQYLESKLQHLLFQSLAAEHAARFISMDSATRNAKELLEINNLEYNKLRQAKITKELTELVGYR